MFLFLIHHLSLGPGPTDRLLPHAIDGHEFVVIEWGLGVGRHVRGVEGEIVAYPQPLVAEDMIAASIFRHEQHKQRQKRVEQMLQRGILVEGALVVLHAVISIVPRWTGGAVARPGFKRTILVVRIVPQGVLHPVATEMV